MSPERWRQASRILESTFERDPGRRAAYIAEVCAGDDELRREVESLLAASERAGSLLDTPAMEMAAPLFVGGPAEVMPGQSVGHYNIVTALGTGGMGDVYLAHDTRLGRRVALKLLPHPFTTDQDRLSRFGQEARAASALNHPNVCVIYEVGETADDRHFIAMEYVEGVTLRRRTAETRLKMSEVLDIAAQVASALAAAHGAEVVHRDIKPENIIVRPDGLVKVLDFGLAKLMRTPVVNAEAATPVKTSPGTVMGTVAYMSPEQARGLEVDSRTDIWSLGVVLYEMLAGRLPFEGQTATDVLAVILHREPPSLLPAGPEVPAELERVVEKALRKDKEERYQTASDLVLDLKSLKQRLEFEAEFERTRTHEESEAGAMTNAGPQTSANRTAGRQAELAPQALQAGRLTNLSAKLVPLVGREQEVASVEMLLRQEGVRLVTLTGVGGTGKTRLAQAVARGLLEDIAYGVFFVDLSAVSDPELVASAVAQPLGVKEAGGTPLKERLKQHLRGRQTLLVLDNFEQVMAAAPLVAELLSAASGLKVLVTSRALLHLSAEREFSVPPLALPAGSARASPSEMMGYSAIKLFVERARLVKPAFTLTDENAPSVAEVCARLDGLPLAIELAAVRLRVLSPQAILVRLEDRLKLLTGGARDLPARHQTMRRTVDWSYDLLAEEEKILFRRLAVFAGGFMLEAAEAICEDVSALPAVAGRSIPQNHPPAAAGGTDLLIDVLDLVTSLVDKSLLVSKEQTDGESRFRMLEVVREYALDALEASNEAEAMRRRHAAYFLTLGEEAEPHLQTAQSAAWLIRLEKEHDNLRAALRWSLERDAETATRLAAAIRRFWIDHCHLTEGRRWLTAALERSNDAPAAVRFKLLNVLGLLARFQGDNETARKMYEEGLAEGSATGDKQQIAVSSRGLGTMAYRQGGFAAARKFYEEGLAISRELNDIFGIAASLGWLGTLAHTEGDNAAARPLLEEALAIFSQLGNKEAMGASLINLGVVAYSEGNYKAAHSYFTEALASAQELGYKIHISYSLDGFAALAAERGDAERAARLAGAAEHLRESVGYEMVTADRHFGDAYVSVIRAALGEEALTAAFEQGRALKTDEAIVLALGGSAST